MNLGDMQSVQRPRQGSRILYQANHIITIHLRDLHSEIGIREILELQTTI